MGVVLWKSGIAMLRSMTTPMPPPPPAGELRKVNVRYRCSVCGIDSSTFLWQCPGCKSWDTLRATAALEFLPRAARPGAASD